MKLLSKDLLQISQHKYLRFDCKYWNTQERMHFFKYVCIKDIFQIISGSVQTKHYINEITEIPYVRIGDITYKYGVVKKDIMYLDNSEDISSERILKKGDLILATIGATVGKIGLADSVVGGTHSNNTVILRPKTNLNMYFYEKLLQTNMYMQYVFGVVSQKAQPNLQLYDLENIKIPIVNNNIVDKVVSIIIPIEERIKELQKSIKDESNIINKIFTKEFAFDYTRFNELKQDKIFSRCVSSFANDPDLRFSAKFHRNAGGFALKQLTNITQKRIKHFLAEPIILGASVSPEDYAEDGTYKYISMATIKKWCFDSESANTVSDDYAEAKKTKTVKKDDIIMARSGEGTIGKVALITSDEVDGIFADFTMRIRLKNYNPEFAYYYFRTEYFQYLIEIYKKGLGNNTNIFPIVVQEFPLIDISLEEQQRIVNEIHYEISKQDEIRKEISELRLQIDSIIEKTIRSDNSNKSQL